MDTWQGEPSQPVYVPHPMAPLFGLMGIGMIGFGGWKFLKSGEEEDLEEMILPEEFASRENLPRQSRSREVPMQSEREAVPSHATPAPTATYTATQPTQPRSSAAYDYSQEQDPRKDPRHLVGETVIGIVSPQKGSGKTSKQRFLDAEHVKRGHLVWRIDPLALADDYKGIRVFGRSLNYQEIVEGIRLFIDLNRDRIKRRANPLEKYNPYADYHLHLSMDEVSNYRSEIEAIDPEVMTDLWAVAIQMVRQTNCSICFGTHGRTQEMLGGGLKGRSHTIFNAFTWMEAYPVRDDSIPGGLRCAGYVDVIYADDPDKKKIRLSTAGMVAPNPECDYRELIQTYCPVHMYPPVAPVNEQVRQLNEIWNLDVEPDIEEEK